MKVDVRTLLTTLTGGCPMLTQAPKAGELDELLGKSIALNNQLPCVVIQGATPEKVRKENIKAKANELYRRLPRLKEMKGTIEVASTVLFDLNKNGKFNEAQYYDVCKILMTRAENLLGKDYVNLGFQDEVEA